MPYTIAKDGRCPSSRPWGLKKTDGGKLLACHATQSSAENQMRAILANSHKQAALWQPSFKFGQRHSLGDNALIQTLHDHSVQLGASCGVVRKIGARHSSKDVEAIQSVHDAAVFLGAHCPGATRFKARATNARYILEGKIHEAYTTVADQLFGRGYLSRETRMLISQKVGELLTAFGEQLAPLLETISVDPEDVQAVANKSAHAPYAIITKELSGYRWIMPSATNAYQDRDKQWIAHKAIESWVNSLTGSPPTRTNGETIVCRWWHVGNPNLRTLSKGNGLDLGEADFVGVCDKALVVTGLFYDDRIGQALMSRAKGLGCSPGFFHPLDQPRNGVFTVIDVFEVSLLPLDRASNPFTGGVKVQSPDA
jgi:hypothetical protein